MNVQPVVLAGRWVRLEPLRQDHGPALARVGLDPEIWRWNPTQVTTEDEMASYVRTAIEECAQGSALPFAILDQSSGVVIGSTRYAAIERRDRRLEIGWTWLAPSHQRTAANTEAKLLLLTHAFERLGAIRVELKTDVLNEKSRRAIERIGGVQEGIFRRHRLVEPSGRMRDTVYYSILDSEWPAAKKKLEARLDR
jgi:RimJ/RimL family protein N-acetyltransferase